MFEGGLATAGNDVKQLRGSFFFFPPPATESNVAGQIVKRKKRKKTDSIYTDTHTHTYKQINSMSLFGVWTVH